MMSEMKKLFVGGLADDVKDNDLMHIFKRFGNISEVDIRIKKQTSGDPKKFAYVTIEASETNVKKCIQTYNKTKWKGKELQIQVAKENFLDRLKRERENPEIDKSDTKAEASHNGHDKIRNVVVKNKSQGTPVADMKNWVVGRKGTVLPVLFMKDKKKKKILKMDPSMYAHKNKVLDGKKTSGNSVDVSVEQLTWQLEERAVSQGQNVHTPDVTTDGSSSASEDSDEGCESKKGSSHTQGSNFVEKCDTVDFLSDSEDEYQNSRLAACGYTSSDDSDDLSKCTKGQPRKTAITNVQKVSAGNSASRKNQQINAKKKSVQDKQAESSKPELLSDSDLIPVAEPLATCALSLPGWLESESDSDDGNKRDEPHKRGPQQVIEKRVQSKQDLHVDLGSDSTDSESSISSEDSESSVDHSVLKSSLKTDKKGEELRKDFQKSYSNTSGVKKLCGNALTNGLDKFSTGFKNVSADEAADRSDSEDDEDLDIFDMIQAGNLDKLYEKSTSEGQKQKARNASRGEHGSLKGKDSKASCPDSSPGKRIEREPQNPRLDVSKGRDSHERTSELICSAIRKMSATEKHETSNMKRLETIKQRQKEAQTQKSLLQKALASVDKESTSKKIIFDSDEEDATIEAISKEVEEKKTQKSQKLFESESEESDNLETDSEGDDSRFDIRPEFEGEAGKKLLHLQSRFGNDERFKLDTRFMESESEEGNEVSEGKNSAGDGEPTQSNHLDSEKEKALQILRTVVGNVAFHKKKKETKATFRDMSNLHYDPMKEDHEKFVKEAHKTPQISKKKKKQVDVTEEVAIEEAPEVSSARFFEVSAPLKDIFDKSKPTQDDSGQGQNTGFSLLSMFSQEVEEDGSNTDKNIPDADPVGAESDTKKCFPWQQPTGYEDSSEDEPEQTSAEPSQQDNAAVDVFQRRQETFFFGENDSRIQEGIEYFHCTEDEDTVRKKWLENRPFLVDTYKLKRKRKLRQNRIMQSTPSKRGRRR